jgi:hypothetical protein
MFKRMSFVSSRIGTPAPELVSITTQPIQIQVYFLALPQSLNSLAKM